MNKYKLLVLGLCLLWVAYTPTLTLGAQNTKKELQINEFMASNGDTILDNYGESSDWIEIFNLSKEPINIGGYYISDRQDEPLKYRIPDGYPEKTTVPPRGYILLWADGNPERGPLHLSFKLSKEGESIILTAPDGITTVDKIIFGRQRRDVSYGRKPTAPERWAFLVQPTPGSPNRGPELFSNKVAGFYLFYEENKITVFAVSGSILIMILQIIVLLRIAMKLKKEKLRYRNLFEESPVGLLKSDSKGNIIDINKHMLKILGSPGRDETLKLNLLNLPNLRKAGLSEQLEKALKENRIVEGERKYTSRWGKDLWLYYKIYPVINEKNGVVEAVVACNDVTEHKKAEEKVRYLSFHDSLTGLYNRAYFQEELKRIDTKRQLPISLIMGDTNGLKLVNDAFGHHKGDEMLKKIARVMKDSCRKEDIIARWGGDEFIILLPQASESDALNVAHRIKKGLSEAANDPIRPSMSLGVATKKSEFQDIKEVLKKAEDEMYRNKLMESRKVRDQIIDSLKKTLRESGRETEEHCCRLKELVLKIGRALKLPDNELDKLALLASLHDIGKVAVFEDPLKNSDAPSPKEPENINKHPETGYRIVSGFPELAHIADSVLSHHENWDGSGYPQGLKGEEIPLSARILAIAHAYETMTGSERKFSSEEALEELKKYAGSLFDPELVEVFAATIRR